MLTSLTESSSEGALVRAKSRDEFDDDGPAFLDERATTQGALAYTRKLVKAVVGKSEDDLSRRITHLHDKVAGLDSKLDAVLRALGKSAPAASSGASSQAALAPLDKTEAYKAESLAKMAKKSRGAAAAVAPDSPEKDEPRDAR